MKGVKYDEEKPQMYLLPPLALLEVGKVLTFGAKKYSPDNWKKVPDAKNRYTSGALRHILADMSGETKDDETGLSHKAHAICCLLFNLEKELEADGKASKNERVGEAGFPEHTESDITAKPRQPDNQEGGMFFTEYSLQHEQIAEDFARVRRTESSTQEKNIRKAGAAYFIRGDC